MLVLFFADQLFQVVLVPGACAHRTSISGVASHVFDFFLCFLDSFLFSSKQFIDGDMYVGICSLCVACPAR